MIDFSQISNPIDGIEAISDAVLNGIELALAMIPLIIWEIQLQ